MTRLQINFRLQQPLTDQAMIKLSDTWSIYGIQKIKLSPEQDRMMVEYDATRMKPSDVEAALACAGIAVEPV